MFANIIMLKRLESNNELNVIFVAVHILHVVYL